MLSVEPGPLHAHLNALITTSRPQLTTVVRASTVCTSMTLQTYICGLQLGSVSTLFSGSLV